MYNALVLEAKPCETYKNTQQVSRHHLMRLPISLLSCISILATVAYILAMYPTDCVQISLS